MSRLDEQAGSAVGPWGPGQPAGPRPAARPGVGCTSARAPATAHCSMTPPGGLGVMAKAAAARPPHKLGEDRCVERLDDGAVRAPCCPRVGKRQ